MIRGAVAVTFVIFALGAFTMEPGAASTCDGVDVNKSTIE